jgi:arylsulfatase A-like enzyme
LPTVLAAAALAFLAGCHGSEPQPAEAAHNLIRLMPETTEAPSTQVPIWEENEVFRWDLSTEEEVALWQQERIGDDVALKSGGLYFRSKDSDPALFRATSLDADRIDAIRVSQNGLTTGASLQIFWTRPGEIFAEERSMVTDRMDSNGSLTPTFTFEVYRHDLWSGAIDGFRLDPTSVAMRRVQVNSISGIEYVMSQALMDAAVSKAWRVDFRGDARYAVLVPPDRPYVREVTIPDASRLQFAVGLPPGIPVGVRFKVTWSPDDRSEEVVFEETVSPTVDARDAKWLDRTIDLTPYGGRRGKLTFSTETSGELDLRDGFPCFANISVVVDRPVEPKMNVVLIVVDTLRADGLSCYGSEFESSPRIDAWARESGVIFNHVVVSAPWTLPSHVSIFTGMDPINHSMNVGEPIDESLITLAEALSEQGYATVAFTGGGYLSTDFALMQGFDKVHYFYESRARPRETGNDIESGVDHTLTWLDANADHPFFLMFHTYEVHAPYRPREPFVSRFLGVEPGTIDTLISTGPVEPTREIGYQLTSRLMQRHTENGLRYEPIDPDLEPMVPALYASSVANADAHIGRILDKLEALGVADNTIVILTSDHGEALGENGLAGHATLQECEIMVPLIVAAPGSKARGGRVDEQVQSISITPTILDLLGLDPLPESDGRSLVGFLEGDEPGEMGDAVTYAGSSNFGLSVRRANRLKYIYNNSIWPANHGREELVALDPAAGALIDPTTTSETVDEFRRDLREDLETRYTGLRVHYANHQTTPMRAILKGWLVNPLRVKSFDITADDISWINDRLNFTLDPGESATFLLEGAVRGELQVVCTFDGAPNAAQSRLNHTLLLDRLESQWQAALQDGAWTEDPGPSGATDSTRVRVWIGGTRAAARSTGAINEQTREELKQLGYLVD